MPRLQRPSPRGHRCSAGGDRETRCARDDARACPVGRHPSASRAETTRASLAGLTHASEGSRRSNERSDMNAFDIWVYRLDTQVGDDSMAGRDLTGYRVEAVDGSIGKIDAASNDVGQSYVIVDTGPWILGKKVMLPAGVIERVDDEEEKVWLDR